jgi:DNA-binding beta-propeller fold protein YncE
MKTKYKSNIRIGWHRLPYVTIYAGALLLAATDSQSQNLFESDYGSGHVYEFTPGGRQGTVAAGFSPGGLAVSRAGALSVSTSQESGNIYKFTPGGVQLTFASGLYYPAGLAFNSSGNLFVADFSGTMKP